MKRAMLILAAATALAPLPAAAQSDARLDAAYPTRQLCVHALSSIIWDATRAARLAGGDAGAIRQELKRTYSCQQVGSSWYLMPG